MQRNSTTSPAMARRLRSMGPGSWTRRPTFLVPCPPLNSLHHPNRRHIHEPTKPPLRSSVLWSPSSNPRPPLPSPGLVTTSGPHPSKLFGGHRRLNPRIRPWLRSPRARCLLLDSHRGPRHSHAILILMPVPQPYLILETLPLLG
ncbi:hypothetical protein CCUS01_06046 [Colletotrichum cuscutae]|uniref:Uncharacterized protein n=1 Tax=Colletotrichum cuscutae TaxID=1209917 RepID=A0AAI9Y1K5_9PEZI|nr:hypothetical protein CCUS01_06046 [Colletotrichum cuscutae]